MHFHSHNLDYFDMAEKVTIKNILIPAFRLVDDEELKKGSRQVCSCNPVAVDEDAGKWSLVAPSTVC